MYPPKVRKGLVCSVAQIDWRAVVAYKTLIASVLTCFCRDVFFRFDCIQPPNRIYLMKNLHSHHLFEPAFLWQLFLQYAHFFVRESQNNVAKVKRILKQFC